LNGLFDDLPLPPGNAAQHIGHFPESQLLHDVRGFCTPVTALAIDQVFFIFFQLADAVTECGIEIINIDSAGQMTCGEFLGCAYIQDDDVLPGSHGGGLAGFNGSESMPVAAAGGQA